MTISGALPVFLCGCFGGVLGELLRWYRLRESKALPEYARSPLYWTITVLIILSGGGLAIMYGVKSVSALNAVNIGITCPLIVQGVAQCRGGQGRQQRAKKRGELEAGELVDYLEEGKATVGNFLAGW